MQAPPPRPRPHRPVLGPVLLAAGLILGLLVGEGFLRITGLDWKLLGELLPRVECPLCELSQPSLDPVLARDPVPGARAAVTGPFGQVDIGFNGQGFRGPEYAVQKPTGATRVMVFGASNVFGPQVEDDDTWPAALERSLHAAGRSDVEVWNGGIAAYNPWQICHRAQLSALRYQPDLVILALSNFDLPRHIHPHSPSLAAYFPDDDRLWREAFPPSALALPGSPAGGAALWLSKRSALARLALVARLHGQRWGISQPQGVAIAPPEPGDAPPPAGSAAPQAGGAPPDLADDPARACIQDLAPRYRTMLFGAPATPSMIHHLYASGLDVPVFTLDSAGRPPEYRDLHPAPQVNAWYGQELAAWLLANGTLPAPR